MGWWCAFVHYKMARRGWIDHTAYTDSTAQTPNSPTTSSIKSLAMATVKSSRVGAAAPMALVLVAALALVMVAEASSCDGSRKGELCSKMVSDGITDPILIRECCRVLSRGPVDCLCEIREQFVQRKKEVWLFDKICSGIPYSCDASNAHQAA